MRQVIAMHGWSGDSNTWQMWAKHFKKSGWLWQSTERGYGKTPPFSPIWRTYSRQACYQRRVVIAHSLGLHLTKSEILRHATDVVLLGCFSRFIPNGIESRSLKTALQGMQKHLGTVKEKAMLNNFLQKACLPDPINSLIPGPIEKGLSIAGRKKLKIDLELLIQTHKLPIDLPERARVLIIQGTEDSIIVPSTRNSLIKDLKQHLKNAPTHWDIPGAGHLLLVPGLINRVKDWLDLSV